MRKSLVIQHDWKRKHSQNEEVQDDNAIEKVLFFIENNRISCQKNRNETMLKQNVR